MRIPKLIFAAAIGAATLAIPTVADAGRRETKAQIKASYTPTGEVKDCLQIRSFRQTRVLDDSTIDFVMNNGDVYRNTLPHSCPTLGFEEKFLYKTSLSQICSVDIITVLRQAGGSLDGGPSCGLGKFAKVVKAPG